MTDETISISIDGRDVEAKPGQTSLRAADEAGIYIPRLCFHPDLPPGGHCRVCTVKVHGRYMAACTSPVAEGLVVENDTEEVNEQRRRIIEMLFVEGNHYCPSCEASGACELQALGYRLGLLAPTLPYLRQANIVDATHPDVYIDRDRCILCGRCVRASRIIDQKSVFGFEGRGIRERLAVDADGGLGETPLAAADKAAEICPTGCLTLKRRGYQVPVGQRPYDRALIGGGAQEASPEGE